MSHSYSFRGAYVLLFTTHGTATVTSTAAVYIARTNSLASIAADVYPDGGGSLTTAQHLGTMVPAATGLRAESGGIRGPKAPVNKSVRQGGASRRRVVHSGLPVARTERYVVAVVLSVV
ncbi:hypothetical protein QTP88_022347 [Uroleucon formosanum]